MADHAEHAFATAFLNTLGSQPVIFTDDYCPSGKQRDGYGGRSGQIKKSHDAKRPKAE